MGIEYGRILRHFREREDLSLRRCATQAGVHFAALAKVENGERPPFDGRLSRKLATLFGISRWRLAAAVLRDHGWDDVPQAMDDRAEQEEIEMGAARISDGVEVDAETERRFDD